MINIGRKVQSYDKGEELKPITHVIVNYGTDDNGATLTKEAVASVDNGRTLVINLSIFPDGDVAQNIANNILSQQSGITYQPATAENADFDILAELGDVAITNGDYLVIGSKEVAADGSGFANIEAPDIPETDEEEWQTKEQREIDRNYRTTKAELTVQANEIALKIDAEDAQTLIDQKVDSITFTVSGKAISDAPTWNSTTTYGKGDLVKHGSYFYSSNDKDNTGHTPSSSSSYWTRVSNTDNTTYLTIKKDGVTIGGGALVVGEIYADYIDADGIQAGTIDADSINTRGKFSVIEEIDDQDTEVGYMGGYTGNAGAGLDTKGVAIQDTTQQSFVAVSNGGAKMQSGNNYFYLGNTRTVLGPAAYGSTLPTTGVEGQIFSRYKWA